MDGILDARFDMLPMLSPTADKKCWCKFTIACFRFSEVRAYFEDEGWAVRPLLVVRDARAVFDSLIRKSYGRNGITADDPPLRIRLRRFREDWDLFHQRGWPILRYEDLMTEPQATLKTACTELELPWDDAMVSWPKPAERIADASFGNPTFVSSRSTTLINSIKPSLAAVSTRHIPPDDLKWIETEFAEMNQVMNYPLALEPAFSEEGQLRRAIPCFETTRRYERLRRKHRFSRLMKGIGKSLAGVISGSGSTSPPKTNFTSPR